MCLNMFQKKSSGLKILFVGSEAAPFVKVGGLGEVMYSLPRALRKHGHDVRTFIPNYSSIDHEVFAMDMVVEGLLVPNPGQNPLICNVKKCCSKRDDTTSYFLENQEYYEKRGSVYGYDDDAVRWALLSRGAIEFVRWSKDWRPDIIVASDWQGGLIPNLMKVEYKDDVVISKIASVFSIHNIYFQGKFNHHFISDMDYDDGHSSVPGFEDPRLLKLNFMRRGIRYADVINTVSPTYALEITTSKFGELLHELLQERRSRLFGILNGIDYTSNDPAHNPHIEFPFTKKRFDDRIKNKNVLRKTFNLPGTDDMFVIGMVGRLVEQKGFDIVLKAVEHLIKNFNIQMVVLGSGTPQYMQAFMDLSIKYPGNLAHHLSFDSVLPHVIYAGSDAILIPSRFEPSGLTQMEAMRYGSVPIVRKTGGLADSVVDYNPKAQTGNGFVFKDYNEHALYGAVVRAYETFQYPKFWKGIQKRALEANFSWDASAIEYEKIFKRAIEFNTVHTNR